jgi:hypothetical protein
MVMNMKEHIRAALREQYDTWEEFLAGLSQDQILTTLTPSNWTIKDVLVHLWAWQQRSIARFDAALSGKDPEFPNWPTGPDPDAEGVTDRTNDWIYGTYREQPWPQTVQNWREGFLHFLELSAGVSERDLLDGSRYSWMGGYPLANSLLASYDHHQEHFEKLIEWMQEHGKST